MNNDAITRVHYYDRQYLRTADFTDEQDYHQEMRRCHNIGAHIWGIVQGLRVRFEEQMLFVEPGLAVDGYGRELILPELQPLRTEAFQEHDTEELDVWLEYRRTEAESAPEGPCREPGPDEFYRWDETPLVRVAVPDPRFPEPRRPKEVDAAEWDFPAHRTPPDDPLVRWPVYLGRVRRNTDEEQPYLIDSSRRPYAGLRGEQILSPSGRARVQIGAEPETDPYRFAVRISGVEEPSDDRSCVAQPESECCVLGIRKDRRVEIAGDTEIAGNLILEGGSIQFHEGAGLERVAGDEPVPDDTDGGRLGPWRIYRRLGPPAEPPKAPAEKQSGEGTQQETAENGPDDAADSEESTTRTQTQSADKIWNQELRIVMEKRRNEGTPNAVVVGAWSPDDGKFKPCLQVDDNCNVTVSGDLEVRGTINTGGGRPNAALTAQARQHLLTALSSGLGAFNLSQTGVLATARLLTLPGGNEIFAQVFLTREGGPEEAARFFNNNPERSEAFFEELFAGNELAALEVIAARLLRQSHGRTAFVTGVDGLRPDHPDAFDDLRLQIENQALTDFVELVHTPAGLKEVGEQMPIDQAEKFDSFVAGLNEVGVDAAAVLMMLEALLPHLPDDDQSLQPLAEPLATSDAFTALLRVLRDERPQELGVALASGETVEDAVAGVGTLVFHLLKDGAEGTTAKTAFAAEFIKRIIDQTAKYGRAALVSELARLAGWQTNPAPRFKSLIDETVQEGIDAVAQPLTDAEKQNLAKHIKALGEKLVEVADELAA